MSKTITGYFRQYENIYTYTKETKMQAMTKDHYIVAQMVIIAGLLDHTRDNLDDTIFEDESELDTLLETLTQGCNIAVLRLKNIMKDYEDEDCDCD